MGGKGREEKNDSESCVNRTHRRKIPPRQKRRRRVTERDVVVWKQLGAGSSEVLQAADPIWQKGAMESERVSYLGFEEEVHTLSCGGDFLSVIGPR